jgi:hypothetical protein
VWGYKESQGPYALTVRPLRAFDRFEPNDDIFNATTLPPGRTIDANIMDEKDTDYYTFVGARGGKILVDLVNRSQTLLPAISVYSTDRRFIEFGPDVRTAGGNLKHSFLVEDGKSYYVQVWSQANNGGAYSLTVKPE